MCTSSDHNIRSESFILLVQKLTMGLSDVEAHDQHTQHISKALQHPNHREW